MAGVAMPWPVPQNWRAETWEAFKSRFIQDDGRVIDYRAQHVTTSEGQSYALLRAVWMRDRETFDRVYRWTTDNLRVRGDRLHAWQWGQRPDQSWGVLDRASASDAEEDIALALLMAWKRWQEEHYRHEALALLKDIWDMETLVTPAGRVLLSGDWHWKPNVVRLNPSYFAPYAYRAFAEVDNDHPWQALVDSSYAILHRAARLTSTGLPPDWIEMSVITGQLMLHEDASDDYGYDAIRVHWRIALDAYLTPKEKRAAPVLAGVNRLIAFWGSERRFPGPLAPSGKERKALESNALYGAALPAVYRQKPAVAAEIARKNILGTLSQGVWQPADDYYAQNWLWFGLALTDAVRQPSPRAAARESVLDRLTGLVEK